MNSANQKTLYSIKDAAQLKREVCGSVLIKGICSFLGEKITHSALRFLSHLI